MHKLTIALLSLLLIAAPAPVFAQAAPTIAPDALDRFFQLIENVGAPWSVIMFAIFAAWKLGKPVSDAAVKLLETAWKAMDKIAQSGEAMVVTMTLVETRDDAEKARKEAVKDINEHADTKIGEVVDELQKVWKAMDDLATKQQVGDIITKLERITKVSTAFVAPEPLTDGKAAIPEA